MSIKFTILGSGSSVGVPRIDGFFGNCDPKEIKNYRTRCAAAITIKNKNILIDTSPDLRSQLIKNKIKNVESVFYTHMHADQTHGINDLRTFFLKSKKKIPIYADNLTSNYLNRSFNYCFEKNYDGYPASLKLNKLKKIHKFIFDRQKILIKPIKIKHGSIDCMSYIINDKCAYASDISKIYDKDLKHFYNLDYFVVDCLRYQNHPSHFNLKGVLNLIKIIKPKKTFLTNLNNEMDYKKLTQILPKNVKPAYDGLSFLI
jgi:phosphoribosyl 1,2-cyclic phosphate phosphodiesterase